MPTRAPGIRARLASALSMLAVFAGLLAIALPISAMAAEELVESEVEPQRFDFEEILERRRLRALVVYNPLFYFLDGFTQRGASYDTLEQFRIFVDRKFNLKTRKFHVVYIPVSRDRLLDALVEGLGDVAVANLTITPERSRKVDFTDPVVRGVTEILVTGPTAPDIRTLIDLAGKEIYVRESSSYYTSLIRLNAEFEEAGLEPVSMVPVSGYLEDADLLEMVNAGLLPMIIVDSHKAEFWGEVFDRIMVRDDISVNRPGDIAWAIRKDSPIVKSVLNQFIGGNRQGTLTGNLILKRYLRENQWARNSLASAEIEKYRDTVEIFKTYADRYDFDWLMLTALGYQESQLDQSKVSPAGAVGVMQLLPSTAADENVGIENIDSIDGNIHAGTKYLRYIRDRYFSDDDLDDLNATLLTFAAYNAGPRKVAQVREEAGRRGLDPNVWFNNVEHVMAQRVGRQPVQYVSHIFKYYIAYKVVLTKLEDRKHARSALEKSLQ